MGYSKIKPMPKNTIDITNLNEFKNLLENNGYGLVPDGENKSRIHITYSKKELAILDLNKIRLELSNLEHAPFLELVKKYKI